MDWHCNMITYSICIHVDPTNEEPVFLVFRSAELWGHPCFWCGERYGLGVARGFIGMDHYRRAS